MQNKRVILSEKREGGMAHKRREFTPESGNVDTYDVPHIPEIAGVIFVAQLKVLLL